MRALQRIALVAAVLAVAPVQAQDRAGPAAPVVDPAVGLPLWRDVHEVLSHPRCANCHVEDAYPRWSGGHYGGIRRHGMNVSRGADGSGFGDPGMRCGTCHGETNAPVLHGPPGAKDWHLAPAEMVWWNKSSREICEQIKDPARNGGRTLRQVAEHVRDDPLVRWGWAPGPGREPAPGSPEETYSKIIAWATAGAPCPEE